MSLKIKNDHLIGDFINCYFGHSTKNEIRWIASSGGIISSILIFALKKGFINGALVTKMSGTNVLEPETFIARSEDEILSACGSKYCPVNINKAIRNILNEDGRYAVVGLPCHIRAIKRLESLDKEFKKHIVLHLGLFCCHTVNSQGTEILLKKTGVKKGDVSELRYRGEGWPGNLSIKLKNGNTRTMPFFDYWQPLFQPFFFTPMGCMLCSDLTNELTDISFGDAWLPEIRRKDRFGTSVVISRTRRGEELLRKMKSKGVIEFDEVEKDDVISTQWAPLVFKKKSLTERISILSRIEKRDIPYSRTKTSFLGYICAMIQIFNMYLSRKRFFQALIEYMPFKILRIYSLVVMGFHYLCWKFS